MCLQGCKVCTAFITQNSCEICYDDEYLFNQRSCYPKDPAFFNPIGVVKNWSTVTWLIDKPGKKKTPSYTAEFLAFLFGFMFVVGFLIVGILYCKCSCCQKGR